jgi:hypothetical protein
MKKTFITSLICVGMLCWSAFAQATVIKPTLHITKPKAGESTTNQMFTVAGTATDSQGVSNVLYSLNKGAYTPANPTNSWKTWGAEVTLSVGTNIISAYAISSNNIYSVTDTVKMVYVVLMPLTVETNGKAFITPNYKTPLEIGKKYKITAESHDGFSLLDWTGGTSLPLSILTNKATLTFTMESNLVLKANMDDTQKPFLKITNITTKLVLSNTMFTVMGRATDNVAVASVNYSLDGSTYTSVIPTGNSWSANVTLPMGSNIFTVYAEDTSGNISTTNKVTLIRQPSVTKFEIVSNFVSNPQAQLSFDGTNYLVVYQVYSSSPTNGTAMGQFVSPAGNIIGVHLTLNPNGQNSPPYVDFDGSNYLVAWADLSSEASGVSVRGAFVSPRGTTVGPVTTLSQSSTVANFGSIAYGGGVYFLMWADSRTTPNSVYGAFINPSGFNESGDFLISSNASVDPSGGITAAYDGTNFLAVWYSPSGKTSIEGCLINPNDGRMNPPYLVSPPFVIYNNLQTAGFAPISVTYDGTSKYLVLFNANVNTLAASGYHILGRLVNTAGTVLTNQITLTSQAGPQIAPSADFDGTNYLVSWNQGYNPFAIETSATIFGQFLDSEGKPASTEFSLLTTQSGAEIPVSAPVLWDGTKFVVVGGLGHMVSREVSTNDIIISPPVFTNSVIKGEFVLP